MRQKEGSEKHGKHTVVGKTTKCVCVCVCHNRWFVRGAKCINYIFHRVFQEIEGKLIDNLRGLKRTSVLNLFYGKSLLHSLYEVKHQFKVKN